MHTERRLMDRSKIFVTWLVTLWASLLPFFTGAFAAEPGQPAAASQARASRAVSAADQGTLTLEADWQCLFSRCARFAPGDGPASIVQSWYRNEPLGAIGTLEVPEHGVTLIGPSRGRFFFAGPGSLLIRGQFAYASEGMTGTFTGNQAPGGQPEDRIALPPIVAGPEGTIIDFSTANDGAVLMVVRDGRACVTWIDAADIPPTCAERGEGLAIDAAGIAGRDITRLDPSAAREYRKQLERTRRTHSTRAAPGTPEARAAEFPTAVEGLRGQALIRAGTDLLQGPTHPQLTPRALYFAWLKAGATADLEARTWLEQALRLHFPGSVWTGGLNGPLGIEASSSTGVPR